MILFTEYTGWHQNDFNVHAQVPTLPAREQPQPARPARGAPPPARSAAESRETASVAVTQAETRSETRSEVQAAETQTAPVTSRGGKLPRAGDMSVHTTIDAQSARNRREAEEQSKKQSRGDKLPGADREAIREAIG